MGFDQQAAQDWDSGKQQHALQRMWTLATRQDAEIAVVLQAMYYMYCAGTFRPAQQIARFAASRFPADPTFVLNHGVIELRMEDYAAARIRFERYLELGGTEASAFDGLTTACYHMGEVDAARRWGARAIERKTEGAEASFPIFELGSPRPQGSDVIAFSLWGEQPRYLRGALHNVIRSRDLYPSFKCRFVIDASVPRDLVDALEGEGAVVQNDDHEPTLLRRLARRFLVADDPSVRRYLIRDADSLVNPREAAAVADWVSDGRPFHVMRDWWTHTDPMLAGMWGGMGGVLPPVEPLLAAYQPQNLETSHIDQWFLRDCIWPSIRRVTLVHDRCFRTEGARPFPSPEPAGEDHVGQNEYHASSEQQANELAAFARSVPSLLL